MTNRIDAFVRRALGHTAITSVAAASFFIPAAVYAQEQDQTAAGEVTTEEIIITGSRIARDPNAIAPVPVQSVGAEEFRLSGQQDIGEVLNDIPALLTSNTGTNSVAGVFGSGSGETAGSAEVGENILQLRGLGIERTLVLVNGRRHVSGVAGSQAVDVGSIPKALIERVEVLTGGASAIYGADAVTGVVNFILQDDFEGIELDFNGGISDEGDGSRYTISGLYGKNFGSGRGNVTVSVQYDRQNEILAGNRSFSENNGIADDLPNPALRFQDGDIDPTNTPNFARFYQTSTSFASDEPPCDLFGIDSCFGFFPKGFQIPTVDDFNRLWALAFPGDPLPNLTQAELALIERAATAPARLIAKQPTFSISSAGGLVVPGSLFLTGLDLDQNGTDDCLDSYQGYISTFEFSPPAFGFIGGCWTIDPDGTVRPFQDGLISGDLNQFGGDGIPNTFDEDFLIPDTEKIAVNLLADYDLSDGVTAFIEAKYVWQENFFGGPLNTFWDLLTVAPDNPFIPDVLAPIAADGFFITRDPADLGPNIDRNERETYRFVGGFRGEMDNGWGYEVSANYGKFEQKSLDKNRVIVDRFFAAIDAVSDPVTGEPICRSDIDPTAPPTTPFDIPAFLPGFFTFNPGDGQCAPANILGGRGSISQEAIDFITTTVVNRFETEQFVASGVITGDSSNFLELPAGPIGFAAGVEFRSERSKSNFDPLVRGVVPVTTPDANEGDLLSDIFAGVDDSQRSLVFDSESLIQNVSGSYDVGDIFAEISIPVLADKTLFRELTVDAAARFSDYSTVGSTLTWKAGASWTPVRDIRFRGGYSVAVRAPNIDELFSPSQGAFFRPNDPCDQAEIDALLSTGDARGPIREANCRSIGIPQGFTDPLTARFVGETSGNPDLQEETAKTWTVGVVVQPRFAGGLTLSADYWSIRIEDAISAPSAQDIVDSCFDSAQFPNNQFCDLVRRNDDPTSPQFLGFEFLRQQQLNIGALETAGVDFTANYQFELSEFAIDLSVVGTWVDKIDEFFDPLNPDAVDPELGELQRPEWSGLGKIGIARGPVRIQWQTQYLDKMGLRAVEIETVDTIFGPAGIADDTFIHDFSFSINLADNYDLYGGVNNVTDEEPFITENAFPVSPLGRYFFLGITANF